MRINIVDNKIKYALNLTSEELVHLMRLQPLQNRRTPFQIVSPVLLVCGDEKHEVEVKQVNESGNQRQIAYDDDVDRFRTNRGRVQKIDRSQERNRRLIPQKKFQNS